jgi:hypothetical protein
VDDVQVRRLIGMILSGVAVFQAFRLRRPPDASEAEPAVWLAPLAGVTGGFTTMVANAAGPIMVLYLLAMRLPKIVFVGTAAWYFFLLNLFKVPFSAGLGLISLESLRVALVLAPFAMLGALFGRSVVERINQRVFEISALALTLVAGVWMLR